MVQQSNGSEASVLSLPAVPSALSRGSQCPQRLRSPSRGGAVSNQCTGIFLPFVRQWRQPVPTFMLLTLLYTLSIGAGRHHSLSLQGYRGCRPMSSQSPVREELGFQSFAIMNRDATNNCLQISHTSTCSCRIYYKT